MGAFLRFYQISLDQLDQKKTRFAEMLLTDLVTTDTASLRALEELIINIHLAEPQATIDDWIEAMSDKNARFHRIMLEDTAQSHFDLDIAIQVLVLYHIPAIIEMEQFLKK